MAQDNIEEPDGQFQDIVLFLPRGDGTRGSFGAVNPTPQTAKTEWFRLDQEARKALKEEDVARADQVFNQAIQEADRRKQIEPGVVNSLIGLAFAQHKKHNFAESDRLYEYAMRNVEGLYGRSSSKFADFLADLAWLYTQHGKPDKAELVLKQAISIREKTAGQYSSELMQSLEEYSRFLKKTERATEARLIDARIETIKERQKTE